MRAYFVDIIIIIINFTLGRFFSTQHLILFAGVILLIKIVLAHTKFPLDSFRSVFDAGSRLHIICIRLQSQLIG